MGILRNRKFWTVLFLFGAFFAGLYLLNPGSASAALKCPGPVGDFKGDTCEDVDPVQPTQYGSDVTVRWGCSSNGSDKTCDFSYNFGGKGQVYRFLYQNIRNDDPTPKVYWCINNTNIWNTGACGTIQDVVNRRSLDKGIPPTDTQQYRYFMVKIRVEQTSFNTNDFVGQFTISRRWGHFNENLQAPVNQVAPNAEVSLRWAAVNTTPDYERRLLVTYPSGEVREISGVPESASNYLARLDNNNPVGTYLFQLIFGGPSESDGFQRFASQQVSVQVADTGGTHLGCGTNGTCALLPGAGNPADGCASVGQSCTPPAGTACNPPKWSGWQVDACWDGGGGPDCGKTQQVADQWCNQDCGNPNGAASYGTGWVGGGTKYLPTGRECPDCGLALTSVTCNSGTGRGDGVRAKCVLNSCQIVGEEGPDECNPGASCDSGDGKHAACEGLYCRLVAGEGPDQCRYDHDCGLPREDHYECQSDACVKVPGAGDSQCARDSDCSRRSEFLQIDPNNATMEIGESRTMRVLYDADGNGSNYTWQDVTAAAAFDVCNGNPPCPVRLEGHNTIVAAEKGSASVNAHYIGNGAQSSIIVQDPPRYNVCTLDGACARVYGSGSSQCNADLDCPQPPPVCTFTADPPNVVIPPPRTVTLSWSCTGRGSISCSISPAGCSGGASGSCAVTPTSTTNYALSCDGAGGNTKANVSLRAFSLVPGGLKEIPPGGL